MDEENGYNEYGDVAIQIPLLKEENGGGDGLSVEYSQDNLLLQTLHIFDFLSV